MGWQSEEFGASHEGMVGVLLADGSEPKPVYMDTVSGSGGTRTSEWWAYSGRLGGPRAAHLRGSCSCGWRGAHRYPIDWDQLDNYPYDCGTSGPVDDWNQHLDEVRSRSIPLPTGLEGLLDQVEDQLSALAMDAPLAALKAVAALERTARRIGREAAYSTQADELSWDAIGTALGLTEKDARSRLFRYSRGY